MGGAFPHHAIATHHLDKNEITKLLKNEKNEDDKHPMQCAQEVKIAVTCFQNVTKGKTPMQVIAARLQTINEASEFTSDTCIACNRITQDFKGTSITNFATDGVSVETNDIMTATCKFLDGKLNYCGVVDNKHNVKNDRYQLIGGSNVATLGKLLRSMLFVTMSNMCYMHRRKLLYIHPHFT